MSERFKEGQRFSGQGITVTGDGLTWREAKIANAAYQLALSEGEGSAWNCPNCNGYGWTVEPASGAPDMPNQEPCEECRGTGLANPKEES